MNYLDIANSPILWATCGIAVITVFIQSFIFVKKACSVGLKMGMTKRQFMDVARVSTVCSIGPTLSVVAGVLPLILAMGGAVAWLRLGFIGSVGYELSTAGFGAAAYGTTLGGEGYDGYAFACSFFCMWFGACGWLVSTAFLTDKLEGITRKLAGSIELMPAISAAAMSGAFAFLTFDHYFSYISVNGAVVWDNPVAVKRFICAISGFVAMKALNVLEDKKGARWVREWGITIAMMSGPVIALAFFR